MREIFNDQLGLGLSKVDSYTVESKNNIGLAKTSDFVAFGCKANVEMGKVVGVPVTLLLRPQTTRKVI